MGTEKKMKSFISFDSFFSEEVTYRRKGWVNVNGKMVLAAFRGRSIRPYHDEMVAKNPTKFASGKTIEKRFAELYGFELGDDESDSMWNDIKSGEVDRDSTLDGIMNSLGWFRVVFDEAICSIETNNKMQAQKVAAVVNKKLDFDKQIGWIQIYERGSLDRDPVTITNADDFETYARTGRVPQRTKIGATMAMFRGESVSEQIVKGELIKGWMTPRGKLVVYPRNSKQEYHLQILTQLIPYEKMRPHMGEFIGSEHLKFIEKMQKDGTSDFKDEQIKELVEREYQRVYKMWATGRVDSDRNVEGKFVDMGWVKIVIDRNQYGMSAIEGSDRQVLKCAKKLDKMFGGWEGFGTKSMMISSKTSVSRIGSAIRDSAGWDHYLKTGQVRRQTEIGRKMSQFREQMDPREHVKKKGDKYVVVAKSGKISAEFDNKKDAEDYAVKNHKKIMKEKYQFLLPDYPEQIASDQDEGEWAMGDPEVPIKWTGDHKKVYKDVMKDRKKKNPKYKEPEKTMLEAWSERYKRRIDCSNPRGFSQRAHCAGRRKRTYEDVGGVKYGFSDYFTIQVRR